VKYRYCLLLAAALLLTACGTNNQNTGQSLPGSADQPSGSLPESDADNGPPQPLEGGVKPEDAETGPDSSGAAPQANIAFPPSSMAAGTAIYQGEQCFEEPFLPENGLRRINDAARIPESSVPIPLFDTVASEQASEVGRLQPGETFQAIDQPYCYLPPPDSGSIGYRQWRVRGNESSFEGWLFEYTADGSFIEPAFEVVSFDAEPENVASGEPITLRWQVEGVEEVTIFASHAFLASEETPLGNEPLPATGALQLDAPFGPDQITFTLRVPPVEVRIQVAIDCSENYFASPNPDDICPLQMTTNQAAFQPFERGYMVFFDGQIWAFYTDGGGRRFADTWTGQDIQVGDQPPDDLVQPVRGFGKVWAENPDVRSALGWGREPEQSFTLTRQSTPEDPSGSAYYWFSLPTGQTAAARTVPTDLFTWEQGSRR